MRQLPELRADLDRIDRALLALLAERLEVCREVAHAKERTNARVIQPARVRDVWNTRRAWAAELGVDPDFAEQLFRTLLSETHRIETAEAEGRVAIAAPPVVPYDSALQLASTRVDHLVVCVTDAEAAAARLAQRFGFVTRARLGEASHPGGAAPGRAAVVTEAGAVTLVLVEGRPGDAPVVLAIEVLDVAHVRDDLIARGASVGAIEVDDNGVEQAVVDDDTGLGIRVALVSRTGVRMTVDGSMAARALR